MPTNHRLGWIVRRPHPGPLSRDCTSSAALRQGLQHDLTSFDEFVVPAQSAHQSSSTVMIIEYIYKLNKVTQMKLCV